MTTGKLAINGLNMVDPDVNNIEAALLRRGDQIVFKYGGMSNGVGQMVSDVKGVAGDGSVNVLRIWSHGAAGGQGVSTMSGVVPRGQRAGLSLDNLGQVERDLALLAPLFERGGRVELRGCNVAVGDDGTRLLKALARLWQVDVYAATQNQPIGPIDWTGPVQKVTPGGTVFRTSGIPV